MEALKSAILNSRVHIILVLSGVFIFCLAAHASAGLFALSTNCRQCHDNLADIDGQDISFVHHWETSMMRFSFIDPFWQAKVWSETLRLPDHADLIEKKCARCHAPMASEQAIQDSKPVAIFGEGFSSEENVYYPMAMEGVSCTLCHQVLDPLTLENPFSGNFEIADQRLGLGPFVPANSRVMQRRSGYLPTQASHVRTAEFCASCHELSTDYFDADGEIASTPATLFPEQAPYKEWLESSFSDEQVLCQDCHMNGAKSTKITSLPQQSPLREGVKIHTFFTENTAMLQVIESAAQETGLVIPDLGDALSEGQEYLSTAGEIHIEPVSWEKNTLEVKVRVVNHAGHKLPTSIPVRRVFIHFAVYDRAGNVLFSSGDTDAQGRIIGVNSDEPPFSFEPHYETIDKQDQVQVYEGVMGNVEGEITYTLLRASHFIKDNRILPKGFDKTSADTRVKPSGVAMLDDNFTGGEDTLTYRIENISGSSVVVVAELKDQTLGYPMIHDLFTGMGSDPTGPIAFFKEMYEQQDRVFEIIDSDTREITRSGSQ